MEDFFKRAAIERHVTLDRLELNTSGLYKFVTRLLLFVLPRCMQRMSVLMV